MRYIEQMFDIAHQDAMELIRNEEDREFLRLQREGRQGCMGGVDKKLDLKEHRIKKRQSEERGRKQKYDEVMEAQKTVTSFETTDDSDDAGIDERQEGAYQEEYSKPKPKKQHGRNTMFNPGLIAALDRTKMSDRNATYVFAETASSLGHNVDDITMSRSSLQRARKKFRFELAEEVKTSLSGNSPLVVHWDGKLMSDLDGKGQIDRLPICVSGEDGTKLLVVAKLQDGTGDAQAEAVCEALKDWGLLDRVCGMSFDTTSSNTGNEKGACALIEKRIGKKLLKLACRHHIMELLIGAVFKINNVASSAESAPIVPLFKRFKEQWPNMNKADYKTASMDAEMESAVSDIREDIVEFAREFLKQLQPRDDYLEFLQLILIFLGDGQHEDSKQPSFRAPGAMHHARWMSKVIYSLKIWMFRGQFKLTQREERGLRHVCIFTTRIYMKAWMQAPLPTKAPLHDLNLLKELSSYQEIDKSSADAAFQKMKKHTWYLKSDLVCLALFDDAVDAEMKKAIVEKLLGPECAPPDILKLTQEQMSDMHLSDFVTPQSTYLFTVLGLEPNDFLGHDPMYWPEIASYNAAKKTIESLKVVNDVAERGVALAQEYNRKLTKDESQLQAIFQVVESHRKRYPDCSKKKTLTQ